MQTSGLTPSFSDGTKKTVTTPAQKKMAPVVVRRAPMPAAPHRAGGNGRQKRGK